MGSKASKKKVEDDPYANSASAGMRQPVPVEQKTSIYGWGQLKHPVKKQSGPTTKKKKKTKQRDDTRVITTVNVLAPINTNVNVSRQTQNSGVPVRVLPVPVPGATRATTGAATRSNPNLSINSKILDAPPKPKRSFINCSPTPTPFQPATDALAQKRLLPLPGFNLSKSTSGKLNNNEASSDTRQRPGHKTGVLRGSSTFPSASALMSLPGGPCFYGQYRCFKCKKYWRSSFAQDGIPQNCSKCGTSVFPRR